MDLDSVTVVVTVVCVVDLVLGSSADFVDLDSRTCLVSDVGLDSVAVVICVVDFVSETDLSSAEGFVVADLVSTTGLVSVASDVGLGTGLMAGTGFTSFTNAAGGSFGGVLTLQIQQKQNKDTV